MTLFILLFFTYARAALEDNGLFFINTKGQVDWRNVVSPLLDEYLDLQNGDVQLLISQRMKDDMFLSEPVEKEEWYNVFLIEGAKDLNNRYWPKIVTDYQAMEDSLRAKLKIWFPNLELKEPWKVNDPLDLKGKFLRSFVQYLDTWESLVKQRLSQQVLLSPWWTPAVNMSASTKLSFDVPESLSLVIKGVAECALNYEKKTVVNTGDIFQPDEYQLVLRRGYDKIMTWVNKKIEERYHKIQTEIIPRYEALMELRKALPGTLNYLACQLISKIRVVEREYVSVLISRVESLVDRLLQFQELNSESITLQSTLTNITRNWLKVTHGGLQNEMSEERFEKLADRLISVMAKGRSDFPLLVFMQLLSHFQLPSASYEIISPYECSFATRKFPVETLKMFPYRDISPKNDRIGTAMIDHMISSTSNKPSEEFMDWFGSVKNKLSWLMVKHRTTLRVWRYANELLNSGFVMQRPYNNDYFKDFYFTITGFYLRLESIGSLRPEEVAFHFDQFINEFGLKTKENVYLLHFKMAALSLPNQLVYRVHFPDLTSEQIKKALELAENGRCLPFVNGLRQILKRLNIPFDPRFIRDMIRKLANKQVVPPIGKPFFSQNAWANSFD